MSFSNSQADNSRDTSFELRKNQKVINLEAEETSFVRIVFILLIFLGSKQEW